MISRRAPRNSMLRKSACEEISFVPLSPQIFSSNFTETWRAGLSPMLFTEMNSRPLSNRNSTMTSGLPLEILVRERRRVAFSFCVRLSCAVIVLVRCGTSPDPRLRVDDVGIGERIRIRRSSVGRPRGFRSCARIPRKAPLLRRSYRHGHARNWSSRTRRSNPQPITAVSNWCRDLPLRTQRRGISVFAVLNRSPARRQERSVRRRSERPACVQREQREPPRRGNGFGGEALAAPCTPSSIRSAGSNASRNGSRRVRSGFSPAPARSRSTRPSGAATNSRIPPLSTKTFLLSRIPGRSAAVSAPSSPRG